MQSDAVLHQYGLGYASVDLEAAIEMCKREADRLRAVGATDVIVLPPAQTDDGQWQCTCHFQATQPVVDVYNSQTA